MTTFFGSSDGTLLAPEPCAPPPDLPFPKAPRWAVEPGQQLGQ